METSQTYINVLCTTFEGLGLPKTFCLPILLSASVSSLFDQISRRLPSDKIPIILTTQVNRALDRNSKQPISSFVTTWSDKLLSLRLTVPLRGGKGGFGSQLRAAGGRMSSKKKKKQGDNNGSNRNLDGRRLRTITETKALAEYLAMKPEMEKKEKEARQRRWQQVVGLAEKREEEIRNGSKQRVDGKWVEEKTEAVDAVKDAVLKAMERESFSDNLGDLGRSTIEGVASGGDVSDEGKRIGKAPLETCQPDFFGFDEENDFMSETEHDSENADEAIKV